MSLTDLIKASLDLYTRVFNYKCQNLRAPGTLPCLGGPPPLHQAEAGARGKGLPERAGEDQKLQRRGQVPRQA